MGDAMSRYIDMCEDSLTEFRERRQRNLLLRAVPEEKLRRSHIAAIKILDRGGTVTEARRAFGSPLVFWLAPLVLRILWDIFIRWWDRTHPETMGS